MIQHRHALRMPKKQPKQPFDFIVYFFMVATPLFELPQAYAIYSTQNAENVALLTWVFFLFADIVWLTYAIRHRIYPLMVMYIIYFAVEVAIVAGILLYS